jgi:hypothetical protein
MAEFEDDLPLAFKWCVGRLGLVLSVTSLKVWQNVLIAKAGIYVSTRKKGNKANELEPCALESYCGHCSLFSSTFGEFANAELTKERLQKKKLNPPSNSLVIPMFTGKDIWRKYKELKMWYMNMFLPLWRSCMVKKGHDLSFGAALPSGSQLEDVLLAVLIMLWDVQQAKSMSKKAAREGNSEQASDSKVATTKEMPENWIPLEFLACCLYGAPSGKEEESWSFSVGRRPTKRQCISPGLTSATLPAELEVTASYSSPGPGKFGRAAQRKDAGLRNASLGAKQVVLRNRARIMRREKGEQDVSDDEVGPMSPSVNAVPEHILQLIESGKALSEKLEQQHKAQAVRDALFVAKALFELEPSNEEYRTAYKVLLLQSRSQ